MYFARNLAFLMADRGVTNYQLAKEIHCHQSNITYWLDEARRPQKRLLHSIASFFDVHPTDLTEMDFSNGKANPRPFAIPTSHDQKEKPTPVPESGSVNVVKIAGRDGSYFEKRLSDAQLSALKAMVEQLPDAPDGL